MTFNNEVTVSGVDSAGKLKLSLRAGAVEVDVRVRMFAGGGERRGTDNELSVGGVVSFIVEAVVAVVVVGEVIDGVRLLIVLLAPEVEFRCEPKADVRLLRLTEKWSPVSTEPSRLRLNVLLILLLLTLLELRRC